jgi:NADH-quinone oxidoreductase subunit E
MLDGDWSSDVCSSDLVLHARGITRFSQIAQLDAGELSALDAELGLEGRAVRDDWVGQARAISGEQH